jgi:adenylate cyclase
MTVPPNNPKWPEVLWTAYLTGDHSELGPTVLAVKRAFSLLPGHQRCRVCNAPFVGPASVVTRMLGFGAGSTLNPTLCVRCERIVKKHGVGIETDVTLLFADIRGSSAMAERVGPSSFHKIVERFYKAATDVLIDSGALIEKLIGDEVAGIYAPGIAGPNHAAHAVEAARALLRATGHEDPYGPWVKVGVGVHTGRAYVGAVSAARAMSVITVLGETANTTARLASKAEAGQILVSLECCNAGAIADADPPADIELRGRREPLQVRTLRIGPTV